MILQYISFHESSSWIARSTARLEHYKGDGKRLVISGISCVSIARVWDMDMGFRTSVFWYQLPSHSTSSIPARAGVMRRLGASMCTATPLLRSKFKCSIADVPHDRKTEAKG